MEKKFLKYIENHQLTEKSEKILIGVSGGRDSIFMAEMFIKTGFNIEIAHTNFSLRGKESNSEQDFVEKYAKKNKIKFHSIKFDTEAFAQVNKISIQMAARKLRYSWFDELLDKLNISKIAVAHNRNDTVETFFINLIRGTGIKGLKGISNKKGNVIRPVLFADRKDITTYLEKNKVAWKDDSSNDSDKYQRNFIRHNIIPKFEELDTDFVSRMQANMVALTKINTVYENEVKFRKDKIFVNQLDKIIVNIEMLKKLNPLDTYLFEFVREYDFSFDQVLELIDILDSSSGKQILSKTHRIVKDRDFLIITDLSHKNDEEYIIQKGIMHMRAPLHIHFDILNNNNFDIPKDRNIASFDCNKLKFPLKLRRWKRGDSFMPLGMNNFKKISKFFIDEKFSIVDKENTWLLTNANDDIIWVVGHRIDNRFIIDKNTEKIYSINVLEED
jgi:tRNA(Ile)-lysidine synthase